MSKPSYATYIKDRLAGFGGTGNTFVYQDLADFPKLQQRVFGDPGRSRRKTPACNAPISVRDPQAAQADVDNLQGRARRREGRGRLHDRGLARRGRAVLPQRSLSEPGGVSLRHRRGDARTSTRRSPRPASCCRSIVPTSAMGRHIQLHDARPRRVPQGARELHVEALNHALANIPAEQLRMHVCWGNYEGPHHYDVPLADVIDIVFKARADLRSRSRPPTRATRTNGRCSRRVKLPDGKVLIPGVIESKSNFIEHPELVAQRIGRYAQARRARERDGGQRLRLRHLGRAGGGRSGRRVGEAGGARRRRAHRVEAVLEVSAMKVGFIGLGAMGALIVPRLMAAGHSVTGWNRSRDKAAAADRRRHGVGRHAARGRRAIRNRVLDRDRRRGGARGRARRRRRRLRACARAASTPT